jgi:hypothetical protein
MPILVPLPQRLFSISENGTVAGVSDPLHALIFGYENSKIVSRHLSEGSGNEEVGTLVVLGGFFDELLQLTLAPWGDTFWLRPAPGGTLSWLILLPRGTWLSSTLVLWGTLGGVVKQGGSLAGCTAAI